MKVAMIARSTLYTVPGGDTIQIVETARHLKSMGVIADVKLSNETIAYECYDLLHFFNIIRPADILHHIKKAAKPYVVSTILVDYSEYDKYYRTGVGKVFGYLSADNVEYVKAIARWVLKRDRLSSLAFIWKGQRKSIVEILQKAACILPNSESEYKRLIKMYNYPAPYKVVTNGINLSTFGYNKSLKKDSSLVLCVARIEGIKNQLNLIKALNNTHFRVLLIGNHSRSQTAYYNQCRSIAGDNIHFISHLQQNELVKYYQQAKVHVLPSWFETTGLSSVEAAAMGCNVVITGKGDTREYFEDDAFYCDPGQPQSILRAVEKASSAPFNNNFHDRVLNNYTWAKAAIQTFNAYQTTITI